MTLLEQEQHRKPPKRRRRKDAERREAAKRQAAERQLQRRHQRKRQLLALPAVLHDDQVLDFPQWCALNAISSRTGRRILDSGHGPAVTQLSPHRIGVTVKANRAWQAAKARERA